MINKLNFERFLSNIFFVNNNVSFNLLIANTFIVLLTSQQFIQFIYDSRNINMPIYMLFGYLGCQIITLYLLLRNFPKFFESLFHNVPLIFFIFYIALLMFSTGDILAIIGFFVYKDGILNWLFLGIGLFHILSIYKKQITKKKYINYKKFVMFFLFLLALIYFIYSIFFILNFEDSNSLYQRMSINFYISFLIILPILKVFYDKKDIFKPLLFLLSISLIITYVNLFSRSTATIVYLLTLFLFSNIPINIYYFRNSIKLFLGSFFSLFMYLNLIKIFTSNVIYLYGSTEQRINALIKADIDNFSPLMSRFSILRYFPSQFTLSPFFGGWNPEIIAGPGKGYYMHSMILSLMTHTGILGTSLFLFGLVQIIYPRIFYLKNDLNDLNSILILQFFGAFMIANISYFFNFPPFWFLVGILLPGIIK